MSVKVALDAMGGDYGPSVTVPAAIKALRDINDLSLVLVGDRSTLEKELAALKSSRKQLDNTDAG